MRRRAVFTNSQFPLPLVQWIAFIRQTLAVCTNAPLSGRRPSGFQVAATKASSLWPLAQEPRQCIGDREFAWTGLLPNASLLWSKRTKPAFQWLLSERTVQSCKNTTHMQKGFVIQVFYLVFVRSIYPHRDFHRKSFRKPMLLELF